MYTNVCLICIAVKRQLITNPVDCFVLVILSHGTENGVYATDGLMKTVDIVECFNATNCRQLRLKPKVVIIQVRNYNTFLIPQTI